MKHAFFSLFLTALFIWLHLSFIQRIVLFCKWFILQSIACTFTHDNNHYLLSVYIKCQYWLEYRRITTLIYGAQIFILQVVILYRLYDTFKDSVYSVNKCTLIICGLIIFVENILLVPAPFIAYDVHQYFCLYTDWWIIFISRIIINFNCYALEKIVCYFSIAIFKLFIITK